jgi:hypothetical protein
MAIETVEDTLPDLKGPDKRAAAITLARATVQAAEHLADRDLVNDEAVASATSAYVDAYVAMRNAEAALRGAIAASKELRHPAVVGGVLPDD